MREARDLVARAQVAQRQLAELSQAQIDAIVDAMRPTAHEVEKAQAIIAAAQDADWGPLALDGEMHDRASYRLAWTMLKRAHAAGVPLSPRAAAYFPSAAS